MGRLICPRPEKWHEIYRNLESARKERKDHGIERVPAPLILGGWEHSATWEKELRWHEYLEWAREHGFSHLIPQFSEEDGYVVEEG